METVAEALMLGRVESYRRGDLAEGLAQLLLRQVAFVAPVPREEDFGVVDMVGTLIRVDGRNLVPEDTFLVQVKSGRRSEKYAIDSDRIRWMRNSEVPVLYGQMKGPTLSLYTLRDITAWPEEHITKGAVAHLKPTGMARPWDREGVGHFYLGEPIVTLHPTMDRATVYAVLKAWMVLASIDRATHRLGMRVGYKWKANEPPVPSGSQGWTSNPSKMRAELALGSVWLEKLMKNLSAARDRELLAVIRELLEGLRKYGLDENMVGIHRSLISMMDQAEEQARERQRSSS